MPQRSPNYPAIGLSEAVEYVEALWKAEGGSTIPIDSAVEAMGFRGLSGPTRTKISALRKYGLVEAVGRDLKVTELGRNIARPISDDERRGALLEAATRPELFRELAAEYPEASDSTLRAVLERRSFSEDGAARAVAAYRDTVSVANLVPKDYISAGESEQTQRAAPAQRGLRERHLDRTGMTLLSFQVSADRLVEIAVSGGPLTKGEIGLLKEYLALQERIAPDSSESTGNADEDKTQQGHPTLD